MSTSPELRAHLLVVEDHAGLREMLTLVLRAQGFRVDGAASVREACTRLVAEPPTLVITDLEMPDLNGFDLLDFVRTMGLEVPVVALTGARDEAVLARARGYGFREVLAKSNDEHRLFETIARAIAP